MKSITVATMKNALLSYSSNQDDFDEYGIMRDSRKGHKRVG